MKKFASASVGIFLTAVVLQIAAERFLPLPVAPARMLVFAIGLLTVIPLSIFLAERMRGQSCGVGARALLGFAAPVAVASIVIGAVRVSGGPWGPIPGGKLTGVVAPSAEPDWSFLDDVKYVQLQVAGPHSVELLVLHHESAAFVGANFPDSKHWPGVAASNPRVVLRVDGHLYPRRAMRVDDKEQELLKALNAKYGFDVSMGTGVCWFFRLDRPDDV